MDVLNLKYKIENLFLKKWSVKYGVVDCMTKVQMCLKSGWGYMGDRRIDCKFMAQLSQNDRAIYNKVLAWYNN